MRQLISSRVQQELAGYATGLTLLGSIIGVLVLTGSVQLPEQARNVVNAMATVLILIMAYMARSYVVHQPSKSYAHLMQVFEDENHAWEVQAVVEKMKMLSDEEVKEATRPLNLQNQFGYMVKYSNVTVIGQQSFEGQKFDFDNALLLTPIVTGELYGEGIPHEILYRSFPAPARCAFLTVDMLRIHKVPRVKGVTDETWIPVFLVRHGPYYSEPPQDPQKGRHSVPVVNRELLAAATTGLVAKLVSVEIEGKLIEREEKAREEGVQIGRQQGVAAIRRYKRVGEPSLQLPSIKSHKKAYLLLVGVTVFLLITGYVMGWLR